MKQDVRYYFAILANEEDGIWDLITDVTQEYKISREEALQKIKKEIDYLIERDDIYFLKSKKLYDENTCEVLEKKILLNLTLKDLEFKEDGPFYYLSFANTI